ncbi:MAG: non-ribosomal peptide synthetase module [Firmicutes bacterium]|nr:non-ribosomal peptide synthetase module [Bacillota bacterium]
MDYSEKEVMKAFKIYSKLALNGYEQRDEIREYLADDKIRGLVDEFCKEVDSTIFVVGDIIYMIPVNINSPFHITNDNIKRDFLPSKALNMDIYLMYVCIIILFGEFYDGYHSNDPTRDFISTEMWLSSINERMESLKEFDEEKLKNIEKDFEYNWLSILEKWDAMDDLKENAKSQKGNTISRLSFLDKVKKFLKAQELILDIGNEEIEITQKAKVIVKRYYMEYEYNRGILDFMYNLDQRKGDK